MTPATRTAGDLLGNGETPGRGRPTNVSFSGGVSDVGFADRSKVELFGLIGRTRSPFAGVAGWPDLDVEIRRRSTALLEEVGEEEWRARGGRIDDHGHPSLGPAAVGELTDEIGKTAGGFHYVDRRRGGLDLSTRWVVRLLCPGPDGRRFALGLEWGGDGRLVDPVARDQGIDDCRHKIDRGDDREALRLLEGYVGRLRFYHRSEQLLWAIHVAVLRQRSSLVLLPDIQLGEIIWGGCRRAWPRDWRQEIFDGLSSLARLHSAVLHLTGTGWPPRFCSRSVAVAHVEDLRRGGPAERHTERGPGGCDDRCPLRGTGKRHGHFLVQMGFGFLGVLERFAVGTENLRPTGFDGTGDPRHVPTRRYDFGRSLPAADDDKAEVRRVRANGGIVTVHLPTKLFAPSKWSGVNEREAGLIQGLVGEVTRNPRKDAARLDNAMVTAGDRVAGVRPRVKLTCPFLRPDDRYVAFGGNGRRPGVGYRIVGRTDTGWLAKCGYSTPEGDGDLSKSVRRFLADLTSLAERIGLVAAGFDPRAERWSGLECLSRTARGSRGWRRVDGIHLRIYGPEDYLDRLRNLYTAAGSFAAIVGGNGGAAEPVVGADELRRRVSEFPGRQTELARQIGVAQPTLSRFARGERALSEARLEDLRRVLADGD